MIIDAHLHLNDKFDGTAHGAATELSRQLKESDVERGIVLHLEAQSWSAEEFSEAISPHSNLRGFINIHPNKSNANLLLRDGIEKLGFIGLKLHPRLQEFGVDDEETVHLVQAAGEMNIPVLIDAFPDGTHLMQGFSALRYAKLAVSCPKTKIIFAHMGGHHVIDFMMLAKRIPNVYFDISYSWLYYQSSSVIGDMAYAMRSMKFDRVFYGSDYPDRPISISLDMSINLLKKHNLSEAEFKKIMFENARDFYNWHEL